MRDIDKLTRSIIGAAIRVHKALGPGLLESAYEACLAFELVEAGHSVERQKPLPVVYRGVHLECGYRMDLVIDGQVLLELKSVESLNDLHAAQLLSYLRLSGLHVGLLINFNVEVLVTGIKRLVRKLAEEGLATE